VFIVAVCSLIPNGVFKSVKSDYGPLLTFIQQVPAGTVVHVYRIGSAGIWRFVGELLTHEKMFLYCWKERKAMVHVQDYSYYDSYNTPKSTQQNKNPSRLLSELQKTHLKTTKTKST